MEKQLFSKKATSIEQQLIFLEDRGLTITDKPTAYLCLQSVSFHRLSAYFSPYQKDNQIFDTGIRFQHIWNLYVFDRELRLLVLDVIERIEIALRTALTNHLAVKYGPCWYFEDSIFRTNWTQPNHRGITPKEIFYF